MPGASFLQICELLANQIQATCQNRCRHPPARKLVSSLHGCGFSYCTIAAFSRTRMRDAEIHEPESAMASSNSCDKNPQNLLNSCSTSVLTNVSDTCAALNDANKICPENSIILQHTIAQVGTDRSDTDRVDLMSQGYRK